MRWEVIRSSSNKSNTALAWLPGMDRRVATRGSQSHGTSFKVQQNDVSEHVAQFLRISV